MAASIFAAGIGCDHASEESAFQAAGQARSLAKNAEVAALSFEQRRGSIACSLRVVGMFDAYRVCLSSQELDFRQTKQEWLAAAPLRPAVAVHALLESLFNDVDDFLVRIAAIAQRACNPARNNIAGANRLRYIGNVMQRELVFRYPPVPLEALGGYARAHRAAVRHSFGEAAVVAVQQRCRIGVQRVDLKKSWGSHCFFLWLRITVNLLVPIVFPLRSRRGRCRGEHFPPESSR